MWKRSLAVLLVGAFLISGCSGRDQVQQDTAAQPKSQNDAIIDPPDAARQVPKLPLLTMTPEYSADRYEASMLVKKAMAQLGVDVDPRPTDQKVVTDTSRKAPWEFEGYFMSWGNTPDRLDPQYYIYSLFHSGEIKDLGNNRQGYKNSAYDALAELQQRSMDPEKRRDPVLKAQAMLADEVAVIPLWYNDEIQAYNKDRLDNVIPHGGLGLINDLTFTAMKVKTGENVVRVAHRQDVDLLNPLTSVNFTDRQLLDLVYDMLVRLDADNKPRPAAAESWKIVDETTIEFKLRAGQKFHDGTPLTAKDVQFTWEFGKKVGFGKFDAYIKAVDKVEVIDDLNVRFKLVKPDGSVLTSAFVSVPILPKHIWEKVEAPTKWANATPIGSGPFKFAYWRRGEEIRLDAVKTHYAKPSIDGIIQIPYANPDAILGALELSKADMVNPPLTSEQVTALKKKPNMQTVKTIGGGYTYFAYNLRRQPWSDLAFRKAMAHVINVKEITETIMHDTATPAGAGRVITPANKFWYNPNVTTYAYDVAKARQILKDAGYQWDKEGKLYYPKR